MNIIPIIKSNVKILLKNKPFLLGILIPAIIMIVVGVIINKTDNSEDGINKYAIVNSDLGGYGEEFINEISNVSNIDVYEKEEAIELVKKKRISNCYELPNDFSSLIKKGKKPKVTSYKTESSQELGDFEFNTNSIINKIIIKDQLKSIGQDIYLKSEESDKLKINIEGKDSIRFSDKMTLNVLFSFALFTSAGMAVQIANLKSKNILKRSFTTANSPKSIIGGLLLAIFLIFTVSHNLIFIITAKIIKSNYINKIGIISINLTFTILLALSLAVFITRIFKNDVIINVVLQIIITVICFVGGSFMPIDILPKGIKIFSQFSPQYWTLKSIETGNVAYSFIVLLFSLALFTAGTFKIKDFSN